mmetsp:Transcript_59663/g.166586  ORF Transcript_59663/g.166586 Transcript_59663/m.166586 type:complete len:206 (+) Transcript_59663:96-713(+)
MQQPPKQPHALQALPAIDAAREEARHDVAAERRCERRVSFDDELQRDVWWQVERVAHVELDVGENVGEEGERVGVHDEEPKMPHCAAVERDGECAARAKPQDRDAPDQRARGKACKRRRRSHRAGKRVAIERGRRGRRRRHRSVDGGKVGMHARVDVGSGSSDIASQRAAQVVASRRDQQGRVVNHDGVRAIERGLCNGIRGRRT